MIDNNIWIIAENEEQAMELAARSEILVQLPTYVIGRTLAEGLTNLSFWESRKDAHKTKLFLWQVHYVITCTQIDADKVS